MPPYYYRQDGLTTWKDNLYIKTGPWALYYLLAVLQEKNVRTVLLKMAQIKLYSAGEVRYNVAEAFRS